MTKKRGFILAEAAAASLIAGIFMASVCSALSVSALLVKRHSERVALERSKREVMVELSAGNTDAADAAGLSAGESWWQVFVCLQEIAGKSDEGRCSVVWQNVR